MALLTLLGVLMGATPSIDVTSCVDQVDLPMLQRVLGWELGATSMQWTVTLSCNQASWDVVLSAPETLPQRDTVKLSNLSASTRSRLLAVIIAERARQWLPPSALGNSPRSPVRINSDASVNSAREIPLEVAPPRSALRGGLWIFGTQSPRPAWRLGISGQAVRPTSLEPWRWGGEVKAQRGAFAVALSATGGNHFVDLGKITALAIAVEPEFDVVCGGNLNFRACLGARGILGYAGLFSSPINEVVPTRRQSPLLGAAGLLGFSFQLLGGWALDVDIKAGWAYGVFGSQAGVAVATVGGPFVAFALGIVTAWGAR